MNKRLGYEHTAFDDYDDTYDDVPGAGKASHRHNRQHDELRRRLALVRFSR